MASPSLRAKVERQRRAALDELPKARLCSEVILALAGGDERLDLELSALQAGCGTSWHVVTAFQFMSGRQGQFAAEAASEPERGRLLLAHRIAAAVAAHGTISRMEIVEMRAEAVTAAAALRAAAS